MNNLEKFQDTVSILVKAYMNDTLYHQYCTACAVGNIVKAKTSDAYGMWGDVFHTTKGVQFYWPENYLGDARQEIDSTGYSVKELMRVEYAFETARRGKNSQEWMFNGLMAVVDTLAEIHGIDLTVKESAKLLFVK